MAAWRPMRDRVSRLAAGETTSWIEIDHTAIAANVRSIRRLLDSDHGAADHQSPAICGIVKADAYGLGLIPIARTLVDSGVTHLAVYTPTETERLFASGVLEHDTRVITLMPINGGGGRCSSPGTGALRGAQTRPRGVRRARTASS